MTGARVGGNAAPRSEANGQQGAALVHGKKRGRPAAGPRLMVAVGVLLLGFLCLILLQFVTTVGLVREMGQSKCRSILTLLSNQIRQAGGLEPLALERLRSTIDDVLHGSEVECVAVWDGKDQILMKRGVCPEEDFRIPHDLIDPGVPVFWSLPDNRVAAGLMFRPPETRKGLDGPIEDDGISSEPPGSEAQPSTGRPRGTPYLQLVVNTSRAWRIGKGASYPTGFLVITLALLFMAVLWLIRAQQKGLEAEHALSLAAERNRHLQAVRMMAAGVAHEIKNPLGTIRGYTQLTRKGFPPGSKESRYMDVMIKELDRINERVASLLHFARPRSFQTELVDMDELIHHVMTLLEPDLRAGSVKQRVHVGPGLSAVPLDPGQFQELVVNLVVNALEASEQGGTIEVRCERGGTGRKATLRLEVADRGKGMDSETQVMAFEPYFTTKEQGSGLGLANCLRIVKEHEGAIRVESAPGKGTRFLVEIPIRGEV